MLEVLGGCFIVATTRRTKARDDNRLCGHELSWFYDEKKTVKNEATAR